MRDNMGEIKPSFDEKRQKLGDILPLDTPFNVLIDSSEACNFRCQYCFRANKDKSVWGYAEKCNMMDWETFIKVVEQIKEFPQPVKQISLSVHGEPLCNKQIPDMVQYIKRAGIESRISMHTNASLLNKEYVEKLVDSQIDRIVVSLQGLNAEKYERVCGIRIDYSSFYSNLKLLSERKHESTQLHIKIADAALESGEEKIFYDQYRPIADRVYIEKIVPIWKNTDNSIKQGTHQNKYGECFPEQNCCPVLFHTIVVTPSGDVYPCTQLLYPKPLGNVHDMSLQQIWNSEQRKKLLRTQLQRKSMDICKDCYIKTNSIFTSEDLIDQYSGEVLNRMG